MIPIESVMTDESVGIDYKQTSMLEGLQMFKKGDMPSIIVDIVDVQEDEEEELPAVYSVKEDLLQEQGKNKKEILLIADKIERALNSKIYDAKRGEYRQVQESDIALLFRNRNSLMRETVSFLHGFLISMEHLFPAGKGGNQHHQGAFR